MEQSKVHPVGSGYPLAPLGIWAPPPRIKGTFKPSESTMATERGDLSHPFTPTFVSGCHSHPKPTSYRDKQKTPTGQHKAISAGGLGQLRQAGVLGLPGHWGLAQGHGQPGKARHCSAGPRRAPGAGGRPAGRDRVKSVRGLPPVP